MRGVRTSFNRVTSVVVLVTSVALNLAPQARAATVTAQAVATKLAYPAAFTIARSGVIYYGERLTGRIRIFNPSTKSNSLFFTIPNLDTATGEGLLGVALHPKFPSTPYVYAFATRKVSGSVRKQLLRITNSGGTGSNMKVLFRAPAGFQHNGGRILFGPDRKLYLFLGDSGDPATAQNPSSMAGKILRMTASGGIPADNPISGSYVFASGFRNSFGFDFDPQTGYLWETENGPECNDELNRVVATKNYGWGPKATCSTPPEPPRNTNQDGPDPVLPESWDATPTAPTGAAFCSSCGLGTENEGRLLYGLWRLNAIRSATLDSSRTHVASEKIIYTHSAHVLSIEAGPDGALFFSDSTGIYKLKLSA